MPRRLLVPFLLAILVAPVGADEDEAPSAYRDSAALGIWMRALADRLEAGGIPAGVERYGESAGGRPLEALRIGRDGPVVLVHGGLGIRDAAGAAACVAVGEAWSETEGSAQVTLLLVPAPNPDALDRFLAGGVPYGGGDVDRDRDGRLGEDGAADVDGDGYVLSMRRPGEEGDERPEALDADGDGRVGEDPPGTDLTRDFAGYWDDKAPWRGDGPYPGSSPETRALMEFSFAQAGLALWVGFASRGEKVLHASEQGKTWELDKDLHRAVAKAVGEAVERPVELAREALAGPPNPGSDLDWACVHLGVPAVRIPVWWLAGEDEAALRAEGFVTWHEVEHPTLGAMEVGGWVPYTRDEPPAEKLGDLTRRAARGVLAAIPFHPVLEATTRVEARSEGLYEIQARVRNGGRAPTDTEAAGRQRRASGVRVAFEAAPGVEVVAGPSVADVGRLPAGESAEPVRWLVRSSGAGPLGTLVVRHPRARRLVVEVAP